MSDNPITRKELYLAKLSGQDVEIPEPITREEKYLYAAIMSGGTGGTGGATPDWNAAEGEPGHILNKPEGVGYKETTRTEAVFDGDMTGWETVPMNTSASDSGNVVVTSYGVKMSDTPLTIDELIGATIVFVKNGEETTHTITENDVTDLTAMAPMIGVSTETYSMALTIAIDNVDMGGLSIPKGVWFSCAADGSQYVKSLSCLPYSESVVIHQIPDEYIVPNPSVEIFSVVLFPDYIQSNITYGQLKAALAKGRLPMVKMFVSAEITQAQTLLYSLAFWKDGTGPIEAYFSCNAGDFMQSVLLLKIEDTENLNDDSVYTITFNHTT